MSTTVISVDDQARFIEVESRNTTAFDQDTRQREQDFFMNPLFGLHNTVPHHSGIGSSTAYGPDGVICAAAQWVVADTGSERAARTTQFVVSGFVSSPLSRYLVGLRRLSNRARHKFHTYRDRIEELKGDADDEGIVFSDTSEWDFWEFIMSIPCARNAELVVTDNGNLRAVWRGEEDKHVGLQFLGGRWIEYVMWTRRMGALKISPKAGRDTFEGVKEQIRASRLTSFLQ